MKKELRNQESNNIRFHLKIIIINWTQKYFFNTIIKLVAEIVILKVIWKKETHEYKVNFQKKNQKKKLKKNKFSKDTIFMLPRRL